MTTITAAATITTAHDDGHRLDGTHDMHHKLHDAAHGGPQVDKPDTSCEITHPRPHDTAYDKPHDDFDNDSGDIPHGEVARDSHLGTPGDRSGSNNGSTDSGVLDKQQNEYDAESHDNENGSTHSSAAGNVLDSCREQAGKNDAGSHNSRLMEWARKAQERYVRRLSPKAKARLQVPDLSISTHAQNTDICLADIAAACRDSSGYGYELRGHLFGQHRHCVHKHPDPRELGESDTLESHFEPHSLDSPHVDVGLYTIP